jgi:hypothetical protein
MAAKITPVSLLSRVTKGNPDAHWRIIIYGARGVGKSTFASRCPGVIMIPIEEGTNQLRVDQLPPVKSWPDFLANLHALLTEDHSFKAVALDGIDSADAFIVAYLDDLIKTGKRVYTLRSKKTAKCFTDLNEDYGAGYSAVVEEWRVVTKLLDRLRYERGMMVFLVGHAKASRVENLEGKDYERWEIKAIGRGTTELLCNWADYVLFARKETDVIPIGTGRDQKLIPRAGNLVIQCRQEPAFDAKTRGDIPFPDKLPLDWPMFERTARMVSEYGRDLPIMLRSQFEHLAKDIKDLERKEKAKEIFESCASMNHYVFMQGCVDQVTSILREQKESGTSKS